MTCEHCDTPHQGLCWRRMVERRTLPWPKGGKTWRDAVRLYLKAALDLYDGLDEVKLKRRYLRNVKPIAAEKSSWVYQVWLFEVREVLGLNVDTKTFGTRSKKLVEAEGQASLFGMDAA